MRGQTDAKRAAVGEYMRHVKREEGRLEALEQRIACLRDSITLGAQRMRETPAAPGPHDRVGDGVARLLELAAEWADTCGDIHREYGALMAFCFESEPRRMIWAHYMEGKPWPIVAARFGYSLRGTYYISGRGAVEIWDWMPEEWRRNAFPNAQPWD